MRTAFVFVVCRFIYGVKGVGFFRSVIFFISGVLIRVFVVDGWCFGGFLREEGGDYVCYVFREEKG